MKVACPSCARTIQADDIALDKGWAKCRECNEVFSLAGLLPGYPADVESTTSLERPFDARVELHREPHQLVAYLPAYGIGPMTFGLLGFATFWLGFVAFWTLGALGVFFNQGVILWENAWFAAFSTPFWLIGFGMLGGVIWMARGTRSVMLDASSMVTELRCLIWRRIRAVNRDQVQCARASEYLPRQGRDTTPQPAVEIVHRNGAFRIPCVHAAEQAWLLAQINDFLARVPYDPRATLTGSDDAWRPGGWSRDAYR